jgi:hypothetical protein
VNPQTGTETKTKKRAQYLTGVIRQLLQHPSPPNKSSRFFSEHLSSSQKKTETKTDTFESVLSPVSF